MIITKRVEITINPSNFHRYKNIIKNNIKVGERYEINVTELSQTSSQEIKVKCDICHKELTTTYYNYNRNFKKHKIYTCKKCSKYKSEKTCLEKYNVTNYSTTDESKIKQKEKFLENYGVENPMQDETIKNKARISSTKTLSYFITKSNITHNNFYNYEKSVYINNKTPLIIICPVHGEFEQRPDSHLQGKGCFRCSNLKDINFKNKNIYLIKDKTFNIYKIGISLHIDKRFKQLENTLHDIELCETFERCGDKELEIHSYFKQRRINHPIEHGGYTEWFNFEIETEEIIEIINNIIKKVD